MSIPLFTAITICAACILASSSSAANVLFVNESQPDSSQEFHSRLRSAIAETGMNVEDVRWANLSACLSKAASADTILVLPDARYFSADAMPELNQFLHSGNSLLAISGPVFGNLLIKSGDDWLTRDGMKSKLTRESGEPLVQFTQEALSNWKRTSGSMSNAVDYLVEPSGSSDVPSALHVNISRLDNWDTLVSNTLDGRFTSRTDATAFWAKGGPNTPELVVEWKESDGSRWMSVVKLSQEWKRYALVPEDFKFWTDGSPAGRGGAGDCFNPASASIISFGLAGGISQQEMGVAHSYWVSDVRAVKSPCDGFDMAPPILETIYPSYKTHRTHAASLLSAFNGAQFKADTDIIAAIPRSGGFGADSLRKWRMISVLDAVDEDGENRGHAAHIFLNNTGPYSGSAWGYVGLDQSFLSKNSDDIIPTIISMLKKMTSGPYLANAGSQYFAYTTGEVVKTGAFIANRGKAESNVKVEFGIRAKGKSVRYFAAKLKVPSAASDEPQYIQSGAYVLPSGVYTAKVVLREGKDIIDSIEHEFQVIDYSPRTRDNSVTVRGGDFYLQDKKWYPLGVNYWPRYTAGLEPSDFWNNQWDPWQYDPEIVEQDLTLAEKLGMNCLSVQYNSIDQARPVMDFMARANRHGIKIHCYIDGLHPLHPNFGTANELIRAAHLPESSAMFAYDVGWEVTVGKYDERKQFDSAWQDWVIDRYGSVEKAENDWGYKPDCTDGCITGPKDEQLIKDGIWRIYVAAYRRFWDDEISRRYRAVKENLKSLDTYALMGARSGYGGTGQVVVAESFPFDLMSGAKHLDFISPEAYGLFGDRLNFLRGGLNTIYGKFVSGGKPVYWAEHGMSIWPRCDNQMLEEQRSYYANMIEMTCDTFANGSAGWWWPGGFRLIENSDFGVVNPDGTPRPAALEFSKLATKAKSDRIAPAPTVFFDYDRDKYIAGYAGFYGAFCEQCARAFESGQMPAIRTAGTGTTSTDCPLIAVGNVSCDGSNPPKYLDAEFNYLKINGKLVQDGAIVEVNPGDSIAVEASVGNIAEAKWLINSVYLKAESAQQTELAPIEQDTPFLSDVSIHNFALPAPNVNEAKYAFKMTAKDRTDFGEVINLTLRLKRQ